MKMKHIIALSFLLFSVYNGFSQKSVCRTDRVQLQTENYRGEHFWQESANGTDWSRIEGEVSTLLEFEAQESKYYRYEIVEGSCNPYYSNILQVIVNFAPVVTLESIDSVCLNTSAFILATGTPAGGEYWGPGVVDGKFIAAIPGAGTFEYYYSFLDAETNCADTAKAIIQILPLPTAAAAGTNVLEIALDSIQLQANTPVTGQGSWTVTSGEGGYFSDPSDANSWFHKGTEDLSYSLVWTIENSCNSSSDGVDLVFLKLSSNPCPGTPLVYDADGNRYPTIQIGDQCWFGENLNVGIKVTSVESNMAHSNQFNNGIIEKYALNNDEAMIPLYGGLYEWDEMMGYSEEVGSQGICPEGWHIPSLAEWDELQDFYKSIDTGDHLKEGGDSGFEGQLAGDRHRYGFFASFESSGFFWASSSYTYDDRNEGWVRELVACSSSFDRIHFSKQTAVSVRCIKNR